jgi:hypothetical protein
MARVGSDKKARKNPEWPHQKANSNSWYLSTKFKEYTQGNEWRRNMKRGSKIEEL